MGMAASHPSSLEGLSSHQVNMLVLGVIFSADLSLEKHVSNVTATCFHHLRRLRRVWRSLTSESTTTLVHAFVTSRVDCCNVVFAGAPTIITNKLQRVSWQLV